MDVLRTELRNVDNNIMEWERCADGDEHAISCSSISSLKGGTSGLGTIASGYTTPSHTAGSLVVQPHNDMHAVTFSRSGPVDGASCGEVADSVVDLDVDVVDLAYTHAIVNKTREHGYDYDNPHRPTDVSSPLTAAEADPLGTNGNGADGRRAEVAGRMASLPYHDANEETETRVDMEYFSVASAGPLSIDGSGFMQDDVAGAGSRSSIGGYSSATDLLRR